MIRCLIHTLFDIINVTEGPEHQNTMVMAIYGNYIAKLGKSRIAKHWVMLVGWGMIEDVSIPIQDNIDYSDPPLYRNSNAGGVNPIWSP